MSSIFSVFLGSEFSSDSGLFGSLILSVATFKESPYNEPVSLGPPPNLHFYGRLFPFFDSIIANLNLFYGRNSTLNEYKAQT
jgi:hypothetical protein